MQLALSLDFFQRVGIGGGSVVTVIAAGVSLLPQAARASTIIRVISIAISFFMFISILS